MSAPAANAAASGPSAVGLSLAALAGDRQALPEQAVVDLSRLLANELAAVNPGAERQAVLGLLIDQVSAGTGEFVTTAAYEEARRARAALGEQWPTAGALSRRYGSWLSAVTAACRFWFDGGRARVAGSHAHARRQAGYRPREIVRALLEARRELCLVDGWPTAREYQDWAALRRRLANRAGTSCRLPGIKQTRQAYGSYARAVAAAERLSSAPS